MINTRTEGDVWMDGQTGRYIDRGVQLENLYRRAEEENVNGRTDKFRGRDRDTDRMCMAYNLKQDYFTNNH